MTGNIRIGIDVGGTFTHAVAIDADSLDLVGKSRVPTTHRAPQGVARGIVDALQQLLASNAISPESISFIAHSTTQATNALLEGDVAKVGIIGMAGGLNAPVACLATRIGKIRLAPGRDLVSIHRFLDTTRALADDDLRKALEELIAEGAESIAASEAFSVDAPENEMRVLEMARQAGVPATAGHQVSQLYGLTVRTRTAAINASMLPRMIESADMTEKAVRECGITAPIMIMRSDGGVMDIESMRRRPILTMLSGPAAGVAAAMMYLNISDGIFLEVGGTSTDIAAIRNGRAQARAAEVGGHKIYMRTLDVRTAGVAGGSMPRLSQGRLIDVGPRSAHIAGLGYASFTEPLEKPGLIQVSPRQGDPGDYIALTENGCEADRCLTTTCAANLIGLVPEGDCAFGNLASVRQGFKPLAKALKQTEEESARLILKLAARKIIETVSRIVKDYKLDSELVTLVGGGGGAAALVPFVATQMGLPHRLAENADVISAIGVALALVRETVERNIVNPSNEELLKIRQEAHQAVENIGADPATISVHVEVDARSNTVRATASGAATLTEARETRQLLSAQKRLELAAGSMRVEPDKVKIIAENEHFHVYSAPVIGRGLGRMLQAGRTALRVIDRKGVVRLQFQNAAAKVTAARDSERCLSALAEENATYGDAGRIIPNMLLLAGPKIIDLSCVMDMSQVLTLSRVEIESVPQDEDVIAIAQLS